MALESLRCLRGLAHVDGSRPTRGLEMLLRMVGEQAEAVSPRSHWQSEKFPMYEAVTHATSDLIFRSRVVFFDTRTTVSEWRDRW